MQSGESVPKAIRLRVRGLVQGVGFRPHVYRLARALHLCGWVINDTEGVLIHVEGDLPDLEHFSSLLQSFPPPGAVIQESFAEPVQTEHISDFTIRSSSVQAGTTFVRVPPDRVVCRDCLDDIHDAQNRRHGYPFTTCTYCGPRYSILHSLPYDRPRTSMGKFVLCSECESEYSDPQDRRFHAQPIACPTCGPSLAATVPSDAKQLLQQTASALRAGQIVALKGLGGFQLLVRADQTRSIERLRARKHRPSKPFAVMVASLADAKKLALLSDLECSLLTSPEGPIVLARQRPDTSISPVVAPGLNQIGLLLPSTPLHHLLMDEIDFPIIATSGNISDEPIEIDEQRAEQSLGSIADHFLVHDRPIVHRLDDSVVRVIGDNPVRVRLARGYAPFSLAHLENWLRRRTLTAVPSVLALGGQQKVALALWTGSQAILNAHIGDLDHPRTLEVYQEHIRAISSLYHCHADYVVHDLHPDYASTRYALTVGLPRLVVQHHHAHAVAAMVEHDLLDRTVLAFTWDGTGLGLDGTIWGGEVLQATVNDFERVASLRPFSLPGGDAAVVEPNRVALALLSQALPRSELLEDGALLSSLGIDRRYAERLLRLIDRNVNSPTTTSIGRLFDAIASLTLGISRVNYEGEAASWLESIVDDNETESYPLPAMMEGSFIQGDWRPLVLALLADRRNGVSPGKMAARFHRALADWAWQIASRFSDLEIVLGGGCFLNAVLGRRFRERFAGSHRLHPASLIPPGDGGLAAGQLAIALATITRSSEGMTHVSWGTRTNRSNDP